MADANDPAHEEEIELITGDDATHEFDLGEAPQGGHALLMVLVHWALSNGAEHVAPRCQSGLNGLTYLIFALLSLIF